MYFCVQFTKLDNSVVSGDCFGVYSSIGDVSFYKPKFSFRTSVDFSSHSFTVQLYKISCKKLTEEFIEDAVKCGAYLVFDCDYEEDIF